MASYDDDWLILAGDVGETEDHVQFALDVLQPRFRQLVWVPGNHELWTTSSDGFRGEAKYHRLVALCQERGVLTPEDPYVEWCGEGPAHLVVPLFLLYDYTFAPDHISASEALGWAEASGVLCADEMLLHPDPYTSRAQWCEARCRLSEGRLETALRETPLPFVLVSHFPLKRSLAHLPAIPRFQIWCGTRRTEDWHRRYRASVVVSGHLHIRQTRIVDGVRFEEVSLGYPGRQWRERRGVDYYLRQILPDPLSSGSTTERRAGSP